MLPAKMPGRKELGVKIPQGVQSGIKLNQKGERELGSSLVRVKAWVHQFTANSRRPATQRPNQSKTEGQTYAVRA